MKRSRFRAMGYIASVILHGGGTAGSIERINYVYMII